MKLKKKIRHKHSSIVARYSVPVSESMRETLASLKEQKEIDVNGMARDFFEALIKQASAHPE